MLAEADKACTHQMNGSERCYYYNYIKNGITDGNKVVQETHLLLETLER